MLAASFMLMKVSTRANLAIEPFTAATPPEFLMKSRSLTPESAKTNIVDFPQCRHTQNASFIVCQSYRFPTAVSANTSNVVRVALHRGQSANSSLTTILRQVRSNVMHAANPKVGNGNAM